MVKRITQPFKLGSSQVHPENSVFPIDGFQVGGNDIVLIAGPCSVESLPDP
jgi:3-deoxy-7-phosphoheptulonate synthase